MAKDYLVEAIFRLKPNAEFSLSNNDYSTIQWDVLDGDAPTVKEINETIKLLKDEDLNAEKIKLAKKQAILDRLGITEEEAKIIIG